MNEPRIVRPNGRLDALAARSLWSELEPLTFSAQLVLVDMADVRYVSSDGLRVLMRASKAVRQQRGKLTLCCLSARLSEIISMAGLEQVLEIYPTRGAAQRALAAHPLAE